MTQANRYGKRCITQGDVAKRANVSQTGLDPIAPKNGARFHFELSGSVQGFINENSVEARDTLAISNVKGYSENGNRVLALTYQGLANGRVGRVETPTFVPSSDVSTYFDKRGYRLLASPTLYTGQTIKARVVADDNNTQSIGIVVYVKHYNFDDNFSILYSDEFVLSAGESKLIEWQVPNTKGYPIAQVGIQIS